MSSQNNPVSGSSESGGAQYIIPGQYQGDINAWAADMAILNQLRDAIKAFAAQIEQQSKHGKTLLGRDVMNKIGLFCEQVSDTQGDQLKVSADISKLNTDIRNALADAQSGDSTITGNAPASPGKGMTPAQWKEDLAAAQKLLSFVDGLQALVNEIKSNPKYKDLAGSGTIKNLQDGINGIIGGFNDTPQGKQDIWGNVTKMASELSYWVSTENAGKFSPNPKKIQDGLSQVNQTVSAMATSTNTTMQFLAEQVKQFLGVTEDVFQAILKFSSTEVNNQRSS